MNESRQTPEYDIQARRAGIRRTLWIGVSVAVGLFVLFLLRSMS